MSYDIIYHFSRFTIVIKYILSFYEGVGVGVGVGVGKGAGVGDLKIQESE
jgi:hypothetical protein